MQRLRLTALGIVAGLTFVPAFAAQACPFGRYTTDLFDQPPADIKPGEFVLEVKIDAVLIPPDVHTNQTFLVGETVQRLNVLRVVQGEFYDKQALVPAGATCIYVSVDAGAHGFVVGRIDAAEPRWKDTPFLNVRWTEPSAAPLVVVQTNPNR